MRNIELLRQGKKLLQNADIPNASLDSELILSDILKISREKLLINLDAETINHNKKGVRCHLLHTYPRTEFQ